MPIYVFRVEEETLSQSTGSVPVTLDFYTLSPRSAGTIRQHVTARADATGDVAMWEIYTPFRIDALGIVDLIGIPEIIHADQTPGAAPWDLEVMIDPGNASSILVVATGALGVTVTWGCSSEINWVEERE